MPVLVVNSFFATAPVVPPPPSTITLTAATYANDGPVDMTIPGTQVKFVDSGGVGGPYLNNESYKCDFEIDGTVTLTFNTFEFEHTSYLYDRLGLSYSNEVSRPPDNDETKWTNAVVPWFHVSNGAVGPWTTSYTAGVEDGWIVPKDPTFASSRTGYGPVVITAKWIRWWFISDGSTTKAGWDIDMVSS